MNIKTFREWMALQENASDAEKNAATRKANMATASALTSVVGQTVGDTGSIKSKLEDPKVAGQVVKQAVQSTGGAVAAGDVAGSLATNDPLKKNIQAAMKKKMKKR